MDLGHSAVHAPAGAHFAPMEDEAFGDGCQFHAWQFIRVSNFCQDRNY
ncbi:hypothetical protein BRI6_3677 [plant metagenome]|uniref:Uncharacterized protein n=1 Tax=plant metagenome TaxID=1297885 RepID=A0A484XV09_9ZZZZ